MVKVLMAEMAGSVVVANIGGNHTTNFWSSIVEFRAMKQLPSLKAQPLYSVIRMANGEHLSPAQNIQEDDVIFVTEVCTHELIHLCFALIHYLGWTHPE